MCLKKNMGAKKRNLDLLAELNLQSIEYHFAVRSLLTEILHLEGFETRVEAGEFFKFFHVQQVVQTRYVGVADIQLFQIGEPFNFPKPLDLGACTF